MATTNPWKEFKELLPKPHRVIGTVVSHNGSDTSTITLRDGSPIIARGSGVEVGKKVLVEDGEVAREVPDLPKYDVQV